MLTADSLIVLGRIPHTRFGGRVKFQQNRNFYCFKTMGTWKGLGIVICEFSTPTLVLVSNFSIIGRYRNFYCFDTIATWKFLDHVIFEFSTPALVPVSNFSIIGRYPNFYCFNTIATWKFLDRVIFEFPAPALIPALINYS